MSHNILVKHGWQVVFIGKSVTAYQFNSDMLVVWDSGEVKRYGL